MATILNSAILDSAILVFPLKLTHTCQISSQLCTKKTSLIHSDSTWWFSHLEICHLDSAILHKKNFTHSFWLNLMIAILNSAILHKTLTQTSSIWLKLIHSHSTWWWQPSWTLPSWIQPFCTKRTSLIHSDSTWWWQPSWILPCWIQTLPSWIQTPCYLLSDSLKNTLPPLWPWLKLIQSD